MANFASVSGMCAIYSLRTCIILLVNNICIRNFHCFGWNEKFLTTKISRITVLLHVVHIDVPEQALAMVPPGLKDTRIS